MKTIEIIFLLLTVLFGIMIHISGIFSPSDETVLALPNFLLLAYLAVKVLLLSKRVTNIEDQNHSSASKKDDRM